MNLRSPYSWTCVLFVIGHCFNMTLAQDNTNGDFQVDCSVDQYYRNFLPNEIPVVEWNPVALATLLRDTHQQVLPYTSSSQEDVWDALIDLDSKQEGIINLIYSSSGVPASDYGTQDTWNREHLWPQSRGVESSGPDFTDVHHLRPADATINSSRGNLFFGDCNEACTSRPATDEAAPDTGRNSNMFLPPAQVRGDIARALFYMALRYSSRDEENTQRLELTDCPQDNNGDSSYQMGYLSDLLQWHQEDPPDDTERMRNDRVCSRWQGNRNVFIDFPELVSVIYGQPAPKPYSCNGDQGSTTTPSPTSSPISDDSTMVPTMTTTTTTTTTRTTAPSDNSGTLTPSSLSACGQLSPGDIQVSSFTSDNPDAIVLVAMEDLPAGLELYMTDNAWTGSGFEDNEGTVKMKLMELVPQGSVFGYGNDPSILYGDSWESVGSGAFALATAGDSILLYCIDNNHLDGYHHLGGFISGTWTVVVAGTNAGDYDDGGTSQTSYKPDSLANVGGIEISGGWDNLVYIGPTTGTKENLWKELADNDNWRGSNSEPLMYRGGNFDIVATETKSDNHEEYPTTTTTTTAQGETVLVSSGNECPMTRGMMVGISAWLLWSMMEVL